MQHKKTQTSAASRGFAVTSASPPLELTRFIGRAAELEDLRARLESGRLLTLTGAGGSGKTRLAFELLRRTEPRPGEVIAIVELAGLEDASLLPRRVAEAFGIHEEVRAGHPEALVELLQDREALLVLDNCEHLVDACAHLVEVLLRGCPGLRVLATSREALGVPGERAWLVPALALPHAGDDLAAIGDAEAVRLFVDRARDVVADFALTPQNAQAIVDICRRLDGIPLAIELAAARVRVLSPDQIRDRLDDAFDLLVSGRRTTIPRHRTLRAAIDWSHDLLDDAARALLHRLSVFRGGFLLDAAESVGRGADLASGAVLDVVQRLVDRSLVSTRVHEGEARYALLETVRQYAAARLAESGGATDARARHAAHYEAFAAEAEPWLTRPERQAWVARLVPELENIREALHFSLTHDPELHVRLVGRLWWFWFSTRHWTEAQRWIENALELPAAAGPARAPLLFAAGALAALQTRVDRAIPWLHECASLAASHDDARLEAYALNYLGMAYSQTGDPRGPAHSARAEAWFRAHDDLYGLRLSLLSQGTAALVAGDVERAEALNLEGIEVARRFGRDRELAVALGNAASLYIHRGEHETAERYLRDALAALRRDPSYLFIGRTLDLYGEVLGARGDAPGAARLFGAADAIRDSVGARPFKLDMDRRDRLIPKLRAATGEEAFARAVAAGAHLKPDGLLEELVADAQPVPERRRGERRRAPRAPLPEGTAAEAVVPLDVRALGPFAVRVDGRLLPADTWAYAKPKELLLHLLVHRNGRTRDQIGHALWPAATPTQAKNSFHVTLHHLRKALGHPEWLIVTGDRYRIDSDLSVYFDAESFETAARGVLRAEDVSAGRIREVLAMARGEFFEGENPAWVEEQRARLRRLVIDLELRLGRTLEDAGAGDEALQLYRAIVVRDEFEEEAHRRLMACLARGGARVEALRHYERLTELLREALDAEPEPDTVDVYDRIRLAQPV